MPHIVTIDAEVDIPAAVSTPTVTSLLTHVLASEERDGEWQLGVRFVDDATMQAAHAEFMYIDEPTDIMTFPYEDEDDLWGDSEPGGDLMISVDTARENAAVAGWPLESELFFLITHGILHLLGWDDHTEENRSEMLDRQGLLLHSWPDRL